MVSSFISRLVILIFGTLYPAYASYKAVRTKNVREYVKWMMYWIVFALFTCAETFTDLFLSFWFPFYYEIKIITVIYLLSPATKGSSILYRKFVHPVLIKREQEIDEYIAKAKEQGYHTMLNLGSKGVTYATSLIMQTAIKGGGGLVNQLRRSYSLSDISEESDCRRKYVESADDRDNSYDEDPRLMRRKYIQSPRRTLSSADQPDLYFPEVDICQRLDGEDYYRQIPSSEEISSGYSSTDPLYYGMQRPKGDHLIRTASLGPSSRVRTRAATKNGLPKRASVSEGGSSWSALEPQESQNETDAHFNYPLSHSLSFPFPFPSPQHVVSPEYIHIYRNWTQNQMFTFINTPQYSQFLPDKKVDFEKVSESNKNGNLNNLDIISEENSCNLTGRSMKESDCLEIVVPSTSDIKRNELKNDDSMMDPPEKCKIENISAKKKGEEDNVKSDIEKENSEKVDFSNENSEEKEKSSQERSGRYHKKPAPTPPGEEYTSKVTANLTVEDEEPAFFTPNTSPKPIRKHDSFLSEKSDTDFNTETKAQDSNLSEGPKKCKSKMKKGEFSIPKKLHMPKMNFSFWHQKSGKQPSTFENSSAASIEIPITKSENDKNLEYFIPLKDNNDKNDESNVEVDRTDKNKDCFRLCHSTKNEEKREEEILNRFGSHFYLFNVQGYNTRNEKLFITIFVLLLILLGVLLRFTFFL